MKNQHIHQADLNNYVDELTNAMDADGNGRIDFNEFFGKNRNEMFFFNFIYFRRFSIDQC